MILDNWKLYKYLKELIIISTEYIYGFTVFVQEAAKVPFQGLLIHINGPGLYVNANAGGYCWVYFKDKQNDLFFLQIPLGQAYSKHLQSIGYTKTSPSNLKVIREKAEVVKLLNIPNFIRRFAVDSGYQAFDDIYIEKYATGVSSLCFKCYNDVLFQESPVFQATKVSFGGYYFDGYFCITLINEFFPNLQDLYLGRTIRLESISLPHNSLPQLIHFSSEVRQHDCFWPSLLEAAPKLMFIHTNHIPHNYCEINQQRSLLQFMPHRDIYGNSTDIHDLTGFNRSL
ncbi:hypothetical protein DSO57_1038675 [Entomophthora muscae]|uniref:Uncharacterized protein n=1 Tax=Entomophthora muscae TaxID=34485 RepID=A0ACC2U8H6_9FUNG|nr:hypothetical protein DSO57_1038675 [Entomophthora muscae]